jgi:hypothetical protein
MGENFHDPTTLAFCMPAKYHHMANAKVCGQLQQWWDPLDSGFSDL